MGMLIQCLLGFQAPGLRKPIDQPASQPQDNAMTVLVHDTNKQDQVSALSDRLSFDAEAMLAGVRRWVECESPTWDASAVNRIMQIVAEELRALGAAVEVVSGRLDFGDCLKAGFAVDGDVPGILILGHLDTVHPVGTLAELPFRRDGVRCYGPGLFDMKGGLYLALEAVRQLRAAEIKTPLPVRFLITSDEEVGSPSTRALIEREAARSRYVLVHEPARRDGGVVTARLPVARFALEIAGQPSHAGLRLDEGRSAIREMAHQILAIEDMTSAESTFSVGVVEGGRWVNCVPRLARAEVLVVAQSEMALEAAAGRLRALRPTTPTTRLKVTPGVVRPIWAENEGGRALYERASRIAAGLGFTIPAQSSGGGSDGNFTGAMGVPTLDGLGPRGDGPHTLDEHIVVDSLAERARLTALLLATLT
jgi:glutamate carboxypeptidase